MTPTLRQLELSISSDVLVEYLSSIDPAADTISCVAKALPRALQSRKSANTYLPYLSQASGLLTLIILPNYRKQQRKFVGTKMRLLTRRGFKPRTSRGFRQLTHQSASPGLTLQA
jgi:hypothetical protein